MGERDEVDIRRQPVVPAAGLGLEPPCDDESVELSGQPRQEERERALRVYGPVLTTVDVVGVGGKSQESAFTSGQRLASERARVEDRPACAHEGELRGPGLEA